MKTIIPVYGMCYVCPWIGPDRDADASAWSDLAQHEDEEGHVRPELAALPLQGPDTGSYTTGGKA